MSKIKISTGDLVEVIMLNQVEKSQPYLSVVEYFDDKENIVLIHTSSRFEQRGIRVFLFQLVKYIKIYIYPKVTLLFAQQ